MELLSIGGASTKNSVAFSTKGYYVRSYIKDEVIETSYKKVKHKRFEFIWNAFFPFGIYFLIEAVISQSNFWCILSLILVFGLAGLILILQCKTDMPKFHAAEHRVHNAYINKKCLDAESIKSESNTSVHCGGNYFYYCLAMVIFVLIINFLVIPINLNILYIVFVVLDRIYLSKNKYIKAIIYPINRFGILTQKKLTTRDPDEIHIQVALRAMLKLLELEAMTLKNEGSHESLEGDFFA